MATHKIIVGMNYLAKPGQTTRDEIIAALQAQGIPANAADPVFDPIDGTLLQTSITFPDTANQAAIDAVNANIGKATATPPLPPPRFVYNLSNIASTVVLKSPQNNTATARQEVQFQMGSADRALSQTLGILQGDGAVNTFIPANTTINENPSQQTHAVIALVNASHPGGQSLLTFATGSITVTGDAVATAISLTNPIVLPAPASTGISDFEVMFLFLGNDGKCYVAAHRAVRNGVFVSVIPLRSYAQAVAAGAQ